MTVQPFFWLYRLLISLKLTEDIMERIVYREIASAVQGRLNCIERWDQQGWEHLKEWVDKHETRAIELVDTYLPHGSGIDNGVKLDFDKSTGDKLVFHTSFHRMDENGYYEGWTDHSVIVTASLIHTLNIKITGRNRNNIKDYLHGLFYIALTDTLTTVE
jgi:hypothetical protein